MQLLKLILHKSCKITKIIKQLFKNRILIIRNNRMKKILKKRLPRNKKNSNRKKYLMLNYNKIKKTKKIKFNNRSKAMLKKGKYLKIKI